MGTIMPEDKKVRDALQWISEYRDEKKNLQDLIQEAVFKYNLNPKQEQYLYRLLQDQE